jgi:molybdopterin/thiamine biosynthesis adenylyltransferase
MKIVIDMTTKSIDNKAFFRPNNLFCIYGRLLDDQSIIRVNAMVQIDGKVNLVDLFNRFGTMSINNDNFLGFFFNYKIDISELFKMFKKRLGEHNTLLICITVHNRVKCYIIHQKYYKEIDEIIEIPIGINYFDRIKKIVDVKYLLKKKVTIIGVGTGGSRIALELVKSGIGTLTLFDFDTIEVENVVRHICTLDDVGRYKTLAVKDVLKKINPNINVKTYESDVRKISEISEKEINESDLVIESTGIPEICYYINEICTKKRIPVIFGGVYERGIGGFVMRYIPFKTACFSCVFDLIYKSSPKPTLTDEQRSIYSEISDISELKAEPGLSIDLGFISLLHTRMALLTLLKDTKNSITDFGGDFIFWANEPWGTLFNKPLSYKLVRTRINPLCPACQRNKWTKNKFKELGIERITAQDIEQDAKKLLKNITTQNITEKQK